MNKRTKTALRRWCLYGWTLAKWTMAASAIGVVCGLIGTMFHFGVHEVTAFRGTHPWVLYLLPLAGFVIVSFYKLTETDGLGTDDIIDAVHEGKRLPILLLPAIFFGTVLTHLCGGSAGREGAALQIGGGIGYQAGRLLRLGEKDLLKLVGGVSFGGKSEKTTAQTTQANATTASSEKVSVPNVVGKTEDEAKEELNKVGLGYKASYQASSTVEKGNVISQGTKQGTSVAKNTTITLTISSGPDSVKVNNVVGMSESKATSTLKSAGFSVDVEYDYSDSVEQGNVISQSPSANASASEGDTVTITVSQGKKVSYAKMPNVIGLTEDAAKQAINSFRL